jgi:hypothetical protein
MTTTGFRLVWRRKGFQPQTPHAWRLVDTLDDARHWYAEVRAADERRGPLAFLVVQTARNGQWVTTYAEGDPPPALRP